MKACMKNEEKGWPRSERARCEISGRKVAGCGAATVAPRSLKLLSEFVSRRAGCRHEQMRFNVVRGAHTLDQFEHLRCPFIGLGRGGATHARASTLALALIGTGADAGRGARRRGTVGAGL